VELYAATGEDYVKETKETILGSSGHALELKVNHLNDASVDTSNLKIILIEQDSTCYGLLKRVISRRWPNVPLPQAEGPIRDDASNIFLFNKGLDEAIAVLDKIELGNAIYYFDPLRNVQWDIIEAVARKRIKGFCETGTEFLIFLFTSDWFLGRDSLAPLPETTDETKWDKAQKTAVLVADVLFGNTFWRKYVLTSDPMEMRQKQLITFYRFELHRWFRYVLPLPFKSKEKQLFHLILCSNYDAGVKVTKDFYDTMTGNPVYFPGLAPSQQAYARFQNVHRETISKTSKKRPLQWRILWRTIKYHEEGICDYLCRDFRDIEPDSQLIKSAIEWLFDKQYLRELPVVSAWGNQIKQYRLNWKKVKETLNIDPPPELKPVTSEEFVKIQWRKLLDALDSRRGE
jgi:three-Cys-motif partner protein